MNDVLLAVQAALVRQADALGIITAIEASGWRVVPVEPTAEMIRTARDPRTANGSPLSKGLHDTWAAMLAAAPKVTP